MSGIRRVNYFICIQTFDLMNIFMNEMIHKVETDTEYRKEEENCFAAE